MLNEQILGHLHHLPQLIITHSFTYLKAHTHKHTRMFTHTHTHSREIVTSQIQLICPNNTVTGSSSRAAAQTKTHLPPLYRGAGRNLKDKYIKTWTPLLTLLLLLLLPVRFIEKSNTSRCTVSP